MPFLKLLLAHLIGDFLIQPAGWVRRKEQQKAASWALYVHLLCHGLLILLLFWNLQLWPLALIVSIVHGGIDVIKLYAQGRHKTLWFVVDQALHILTLVVLWILWFHPDIPYKTLLHNPRIWLYLTAFLLLTAVANIVIRTLLAGWTAALADGADASLNHAGQYIGMLERLFVFVFILIGHWEAIGFLLAAKSVFRFSDLKEARDRKLTEYILTGTLLSFGLAIVTGLLMQLLLSNLPC